MMEWSSPGKARDILVACCKRKEGKGIWSIARELMRPYSTVRGWLVRMMRCGLGGRFDRKSTGRKKTLGQHILKKIMEWTRWDPLEVWVRTGVMAFGHGKRDAQEGDWQACQASHAAEDPAPPRPFVLQA